MKNLIIKMLDDYHPQTKNEYERAIHEIIQEIALLGLWRSKFFEHAAFYGGTALRILYGLDRFSEDLDFSLLKLNRDFNLLPFLKSIEEELEISGLPIDMKYKNNRPNDTIQSAFLKTGTLETFIRIGLDESLRKYIQSNEVIKIKLEIDIDPPPHFATEVRYLLKPIPFSVRSYIPEDLFAGKMHALLCRPYKVRVKGRDWYDFVWYITKNIPLHLAHLESRLRQSGHYSNKTALTQTNLLDLMKEKIMGLNVTAAKEDIRRFIRDPKALDVWSQDFFLNLLSRLRFTTSNP